MKWSFGVTIPDLLEFNIKKNGGNKIKQESESLNSILLYFLNISNIYFLFQGQLGSMGPNGEPGIPGYTVKKI